MNTNRLFRELLLFSVFLLLGFVLVEVGLNIIVKDSEISSGVFLGKELPPLRPLPPGPVPDYQSRIDALEKSRAEWFESLIVANAKITRGDLWGIFREDGLLGHAPQENTISKNGWWQSNNVGARSRRDTAPTKSVLKQRILFFGDSYTQGSRVPQEETFVWFLNMLAKKTEAINFGVDGYSMGQAYLRFGLIKDQLEFDRVILVIVPTADLWRDINVNRYIGGGWPSYWAYPRFIESGTSLNFIPGPYKNLRTLLDDNKAKVSPRLINHLREYDRFYIDSWYEKTPILDKSVMFRLAKVWWSQRKEAELAEQLKQPGSEAMRLVKKIFAAMDLEVKNKAAKFSLFVLPTYSDIKKYSGNREYKLAWDQMSASLCVGLNECFDLMSDLQSVSEQDLDKGYDGSHYGPSTNRRIAQFIRSRIAL